MTSLSSRSRKRRAGVAYIEALAVSSLFVLLLACALRFERASRARLTTERGLRTAAWTQALRGCARTDRELIETAQALAGLPPLAAADRLRQAASSSAVSAPPGRGQSVACNEPRQAARWIAHGDVEHFLAGVLAGGEAP
jgi:hypothetical protein